MQAERSGTFVEGWSDRPHVAQELLPLWDSFCALCAWEPEDLREIVAWVETKWRHEDEPSRALIADVFSDLVMERRRLIAARQPQAPDTHKEAE